MTVHDSGFVPRGATAAAFRRNLGRAGRVLRPEEHMMADVRYEVVEHDGGWAYKLGDVFSETFPDRDTAVKRAKAVAAEQRVPGEGGPIRYQDRQGTWHDEVSAGNDRPSPDVTG